MKHQRILIGLSAILVLSTLAGCSFEQSMCKEIKSSTFDVPYKCISLELKEETCEHKVTTDPDGTKYYKFSCPSGSWTDSKSSDNLKAGYTGTMVLEVLDEKMASQARAKGLDPSRLVAKVRHAVRTGDGGFIEVEAPLVPKGKNGDSLSACIGSEC